MPIERQVNIMARIPSGMRKKENGLFEKRFTVEGKRYSAYGRSTKECAENELRIREEIMMNGRSPGEEQSRTAALK